MRSSCSPDCFGFPASLPSLLAHCGLKGFSTQKLTWHSTMGIPFNVGVWEGLDGKSVIAALNPGDYVGKVKSDLSKDPEWIKRIEDNGAKYGVYTDYHYYGVGDRGGAPTEDSVKWIETALKSDGPIKVVSAEADAMFKDITPEQAKKLPRYKGDLPPHRALRRLHQLGRHDEALEPHERNAGRRRRARLRRRPVVRLHRLSHR